MGFFDTRYIESVGTSVVRVVEDKNIFDSIKLASKNALFTGEDITDVLLDSVASSIATRSKAMYQYGGNGYVYGLPSGEVFFNTHGRAEIQAVLNTAEQAPVTLAVTRLGPLNAIHYGWIKLVSNHGYNVATNILGNLTATADAAVAGSKVYLMNMVLELPSANINNYDPLALEVIGKNPTKVNFPGKKYSNYVDEFGNAVNPVELIKSPVVSAAVTSPRLKIYYVKKVPIAETAFGTTDVFGTFIIDVPEFNSTADYFHAEYSKNNVV